jgi:hypothetical protein
MHNGLKPSRRSFKGVGFARALPSAFGFQNWWHGDAVNDYFDIPGLAGKPLPASGAFEFWFLKTHTTARDFINIPTSEVAEAFLIRSMSTFTVGGIPGLTSPTIPVSATPYHAVVTWGGGRAVIYINGGKLQDIASVGVTQLPITTFNIMRQTNASRYVDLPVNEFRMYNKLLTDDEVRITYNSGLGENPPNTEKLVMWLQFNRFETLDFSSLQNNSDLRLGVRDMSGNNNHAQAINQDTNPASGGYVLKPI